MYFLWWHTLEELGKSDSLLVGFCVGSITKQPCGILPFCFLLSQSSVIWSLRLVVYVCGPRARTAVVTGNQLKQLHYLPLIGGWEERRWQSAPQRTRWRIPACVRLYACLSRYLHSPGHLTFSYHVPLWVIYYFNRAISGF